MQVRGAELVPATFNEKDNTIEVVWTVGARVRRYDYWNGTYYDEELVVSEEAIDMTRFDAGTVQVLDNHRMYGGVSSIIGVAQSARIEDGKGIAVLRLSTRPEMAGIVADIKAGIIRSISFGYNVTRYEVTKAADRDDGVNWPLYRAVAWTPFEISFVTVPADAETSTRQAQAPAGGMPCEFITRAPAQSTQPSKDSSMTVENQPGAAPTPAQAENQNRQAAPAGLAPAAQPTASDAVASAAAAAATRAADITELCTRHGVSNLAAGLIRSGSTMEQVRSAVLDELARDDLARGGHTNVTRIETLSDAQQTRMAGIEEALAHRIDTRAKLTDNGRQFRGMSLLELGREFLQERGIETRGMDRMSLAARMLNFRSGMHTTSDFANLFLNVATKRLRGAYEENAGSYKRWARKAPNAPDFKSINLVQLSAAPELLQLNEHGEYKYGTMKDAGLSYALVTYGRMISLTRHAIINDDLRAFDRIVSAFGGSAGRLENRLVYSQLTSNPTMGDGTALFHADHGNMGTGAGSALALASLKAGRKAMRVQKGLGNEELNLAPSFLIVPAELEQDAYQLTSSNYVPAKASDVNEFRQGGRTAVEPIIEPILDGVSSTNWYLASNNGQVDTVEYCYLDGAEGPVIDSEASFDTDGVTWKCRLDFAAKAVDHRGLYRANGA